MSWGQTDKESLKSLSVETREELHESSRLAGLRLPCGGRLNWWGLPNFTVSSRFMKFGRDIWKLLGHVIGGGECWVLPVDRSIYLR
jgi:hypothetical protein